MLSAVLDTCVLVPSRLRDVLLELASAGLYRPLWSEEILVELRDTLSELGTRRGVESTEMQAEVAWLLDRMRVNFADACVSGWERHQRSVTLPDPKDHHVAAAAIAGRADLIVTDNRKDFPTDQLPYGIEVRFSVRHLLHPDVAAMVDAAAHDAARFERDIAETASAEWLWLWRTINDMIAEPDRKLYTAGRFARAYRRCLDEGFAQGSAGYARDLLNTLGPWPVPAERISAPVDLWYGQLDTSPVHSPDLGQTLLQRLPTLGSTCCPMRADQSCGPDPRRSLKEYAS